MWRLTRNQVACTCGSNPGGGEIFFTYLVVSLRIGYLKAVLKHELLTDRRYFRKLQFFTLQLTVT